VHTEFWWGSLRERDHLDNIGVDGRIKLNGSTRNWLGWGGGRGLD
jgi:hypothetical protein